MTGWSSAEELRELIELTVRYVRASEALLWYAETVGPLLGLSTLRCLISGPFASCRRR